MKKTETLLWLSKVSIFCVVLSINQQLSTFNSFAAIPFNEEHWSPRSAALGNAYTALAQGPSSIWFNPAGTLSLKYPSIMYSFLVPHISRENIPFYGAQGLSYSQPISKQAAWGIGWSNFRVKGAYRENTLLLNASARVNSFLPFDPGDLRVGINLKGLLYTVSHPGEDIFDAASHSEGRKSAFGLDTGISYLPYENLSFGFSFLNLNKPPLHFDDTWPRVPASIRMGVAYHLSVPSFLNELGLRKIVPTLEVVREKDETVKYRTNAHFGTQIIFGKERVILSGGVNSTEATAGISLGRLRTRQFSFAVDYAFLYGYGRDIRDRRHMLSLQITKYPVKEETPPPVKEERISPYRFGPGDVIQIITRNHEEFSGKFLVDPYGVILIPLIGEIKVEGYAKEELPEILKTEIARYVEDPEIIVSIVQYRSKIIYVLGEVRSPGKYPIEGDALPLREAIAAAGFPTGLAATWRVYIIKPSMFKPTYRIINFYDILYRGKLANNVMLIPGDVVYVPMTILGKFASSLSYLLDPFFRARSIATPLSTPRPLIDETVDTTP